MTRYIVLIAHYPTQPDGAHMAHVERAYSARDAEAFRKRHSRAERIEELQP